ncbi:hypothetical protein [Roseateles violae]|uniref:Outer membrane protein beta-barrel domain-containing protein n=1 Tax=Roseateles violae TaxID=3058042 RepID=A0ABT8DX76_9BURK|nr:hypothetical protein [Pelomonas sp. PFR6]MDN3921076.1 hypothetical protein [Pelomonas sp. PFR6]
MKPAAPAAPLSPSAARVARSGLALLLLCSGLPALAGDGVQTSVGSASPRWQARVQLSSQDGGPYAGGESQRYMSSRFLSANLLGDYYLTGSGLGGVRGGLRATGGMLMGPLSMSQTGAGLSLGSSTMQYGQNLAIGQRSMSLLSPNPELGDPSLSMSYLGIGYTGHALRSGISFSADVGLMNGASGLRLGNSNAAGIEDVLRDMRYKPVLQLGLSYSY